MKTVVIGMSGGVDSSVAAYLLQKAGYQVIALFMRNWDSDVNNDVLGHKLTTDICSQEVDYNDAEVVCKQLNIPLHRVDFTKEYWDYVFKYFLTELEAGRTPNPDVMCNKFIKFDLFKKEAQKLGADYIATGHYAKIIDGRLYKAKDENKDQSYFLSMLTNDQLQNVLMPLGEMMKSEVRALAKKLNLQTANKKDSTGICFIGERHFNQFLSNYLPNQPGVIKMVETEEELGQHIGLMHYTIGQRKGINTKLNEQLFVCKKDLENNTLYVCKDEKYLFSKALLADNFVLRNKINDNLTAKFRYRQADVKVNVSTRGDQLLIEYQAAKAVAPGQIAVLYDGEECIGGGIIKEVFNSN